MCLGKGCLGTGSIKVDCGREGTDGKLGAGGAFWGGMRECERRERGGRTGELWELWLGAFFACAAVLCQCRYGCMYHLANARPPKFLVRCSFLSLPLLLPLSHLASWALALRSSLLPLSLQEGLEGVRHCGLAACIQHKQTSHQSRSWLSPVSNGVGLGSSPWPGLDSGPGKLKIVELAGSGL